MFIAYIALGIASGFIAAIVTLLAGSGFLMAFTAYVLVGMAGMAIGVLWMLYPQRTAQTKRPIPQRS